MAKPSLQEYTNQLTKSPVQGYNYLASYGVTAGPVNPKSGMNQGVLGASTAPTGTSANAGISQQPQGTMNAPMQEVPGQPQIDWDGLIAPALQGLDAAEQAARGSSAADIQSIESARTSGIARTNQSITSQLGTLDQTAQKQNQNAMNAEDEARKQYSEIQQGLQARYGGTTGTGAFAGELAGRQTLKNMGQIKQTLSNVIQEIGTKKQQVEEVGRIALQDIEDNTRDLITKEKANLDTALAQIRNERGQLQMWKASKAAEAIQNYQSQVQSINANNTAFKQQLFLRQQDAQAKLDAALARGQEVAKSISVEDLTGLANQLTPVGLGVSVSGGYGPNGSITDPRFTIAPEKPKEESLEEKINRVSGS